MPTGHLFLSIGRFRSFEEMRSFIEASYTEDGDAVPSEFMREVQLSHYEPGCIEAIFGGLALPLRELLLDASYSQQWLTRFDETRQADSAICVFEPNLVHNPEGCSLDYCGSFAYDLDPN